jgi:hypothetical protein
MDATDSQRSTCTIYERRYELRYGQVKIVVGKNTFYAGVTD